MTVLWLVLFACVGGKAGAPSGDTDTGGHDDTDVVAADADGDGYTADQDCDDADEDVHPGAAEHCGGGDDDCDGDPDAGAVDATAWYEDADGDGFGNADTTETACASPAGYVGVAGDCDDTLATVSPDGVETCDGLDDDCDGTVDDVASPPTWYRDADGDGYGDASVPVEACSPGDGWVADASDCDDADAGAHPGAVEILGDGGDDDCDGEADATPFSDASYTWTAARNVVALHTDDGWALVGAADQVTDDTGVVRDDAGVTFVLATGATTPDQAVIWQGGSGAYPLGDRLDAAASSDRLWVAMEYERKAYQYFTLHEIAWDWSSKRFSAGAVLNVTRTGSALATDVDVRVDAAGYVWALASAPDVVEYMTALDYAGSLIQYASSYDDTLSGDTCVVSPDDGATSGPRASAAVCDGASCWAGDLDSSSGGGIYTSASDPWTTGFTEANSHGGWLVLAETTGGLTVRDDAGTSSWHLLDGYDVLDADAAWSGSTLVVHAAVSDVDGDGLDDLVLAYGDPDVGLTVDARPFVVGGVTRSAHSAAVEIDGTDVLLAASADDDVAWAFVALP